MNNEKERKVVQILSITWFVTDLCFYLSLLWACAMLAFIDFPDELRFILVPPLLLFFTKRFLQYLVRSYSGTVSADEARKDIEKFFWRK